MRLPNLLPIAALLSTTAVALRALPAPASGPADAPWSEGDQKLAADARAGGPVVTFVHVPLCSNKMIDCGSEIAGKPGDPTKNIYWGAIFGARRIFDRRGSPWTQVEVKPWDGSTERMVYRMRVAGRAWGAERDVEVIAVLQTTHGDQTDRVVDEFWNHATQGGTVTFSDGGRERRVNVNAVGYAGHNRLMDGKLLPAAPAAGQGAPIPSFVLACRSEPWWGPSLRAAGSTPLLTTRDLMAPEGYLVDAAVRSIANNGSPKAIRNAAIAASQSWQKLEYGTAAWIFAPFSPRP